MKHTLVNREFDKVIKRENLRDINNNTSVHVTDLSLPGQIFVFKCFFFIWIKTALKVN